MKTLKEIWRAISEKDKRYLSLALFLLGTVGFIAIFILPLLFNIPALFKWMSFDATSNDVTNTINGIASPVIALVAALLTFLAFWIQYQANVEQRTQFKKQADDTAIQRFENTFFQMLKLHIDNVSEIYFESNNETFRGRVAFQKASYDLRSIFDGIERTITLGTIFPSNNVEPEEKLSEDELETALFHYKFNFAYALFFWGSTGTPRIELAGNTYSFTTLRLLDRPFNRWHAFLGHYYRHLFLMVKFVVESDVVIQYNDKMRYLKILRAQLSNYEQIMLFYNWLAHGYGDAWENDQNQFFTKYKMIHNLWWSELIDHTVIRKAVNELIDIYNQDPGEKPLFEFQGEDFEAKLNI